MAEHTAEDIDDVFRDAALFHQITGQDECRYREQGVLVDAVENRLRCKLHRAVGEICDSETGQPQRYVDRHANGQQHREQHCKSHLGRRHAAASWAAPGASPNSNMKRWMMAMPKNTAGARNRKLSLNPSDGDIVG